MNSHVANLLKRFRAVYGEPKSEEPDVLMAEYGRALKGYSAAAIERAGDRLIDGLREDGKPRRFWPTVSECREACNDASEYLAAEARRNEPPKPPEPLPPPPSAEEVARVNELVQQMKRQMQDNAAVMHKPIPDVDWTRTMRPGFEEMQNTSPNRFHRRRA